MNDIISDTTITVFEVLCTVYYHLHCEFKMDIKYSYAWVFIEMQKQFNFANGPIKIVEKTKKTLSWNYIQLGINQYSMSIYVMLC